MNQELSVKESILQVRSFLKEALLRYDMDYILGQALEQISGGADILDVNVGLPGIDERE